MSARLNEKPGDTPTAVAAGVLDAHRHRLVRGILRADNELTEALCELAAADQQTWDHEEWRAVLSELSGSDMTVDEFLDLYGP